VQMENARAETFDAPNFSFDIGNRGHGVIEEWHGHPARESRAMHGPPLRLFPDENVAPRGQAGFDCQSIQH
jgi:hypothetical protein